MFVNEERLSTLFDLPIHLPQSSIPAGDWVAIATLQLQAGVKLDFRWLQIHVTDFANSNTSDPCGITGQNSINPAFTAGSIASVFLIKDWSPASAPWTQTVIDQVLAPANFDDARTVTAPFVSVRSMAATPTPVTDAGTYTFVALNNTTNRTVTLSVSGAVTVDTDPL